MKCRVYQPEDAGPIYGRGTRVKFRRTLPVGTGGLNPAANRDIEPGATATIVTVFPSTVVDLDDANGESFSQPIRVRVGNGGLLKDDFDIIDVKPVLRVVK